MLVVCNITNVYGGDGIDKSSTFGVHGDQVGLLVVVVVLDTDLRKIIG